MRAKRRTNGTCVPVGCAPSSAQSCGPVDGLDGCGKLVQPPMSCSLRGGGQADDLTDKILAILKEHDVFVTAEHVTPFAAEVQFRLGRRLELHQWFATRGNFGTYDILGLIIDAKASDLDEALWRAFLATHFGRLSAGQDRTKIESAGRFLYGFKDEPMWTWAHVSANREPLAVWLHAYMEEVKKLAFGNHRKLEGKNDPQHLYDVIVNFVAWVEVNGGSPTAAFDVPGAATPQDRYKGLYSKLSGAWPRFRFGRLACFDLLDLLDKMELMEVKPNSCYVANSSGPRRGALKLCGLPRVDNPSKDIQVKMGRLADDVAERLDLPYAIVEDALCCWQKEPASARAGG